MLNNLNDIIQFPNRLQQKESYWQYLTPEFDVYLQGYLKVFEQHRKEMGIIPSAADWKQLPFGDFAQTSDWKWRRQSLSIFQQLIQNKTFTCALEIGPWNGWLTKYLAKNADTVIAADYFVCPFDGIGNIKNLKNNIIPVQCNVATLQLDFKPQSFDLIVLNHNLAYMNNPIEYAQQLLPLLKPKGLLFSIGNTFFQNPDKKIHLNRKTAEQFYHRYGIDLYIQPIKGYLDLEDKRALLTTGFKIKPYPGKFWQNLYSKWNTKAPYFNYIIYNNV